MRHAPFRNESQADEDAYVLCEDVGYEVEEGNCLDAWEDFQDSFEFMARSTFFSPTCVAAQVVYHVAMFMFALLGSVMVMLYAKPRPSMSPNLVVSVAIWIVFVMTFTELFICFGSYGFRWSEYYRLRANAYTTILCVVNLCFCVLHQIELARHMLHHFLIYPGLMAMTTRGLYDILCIARIVAQPINRLTPVEVQGVQCGRLSGGSFSIGHLNLEKGESMLSIKKRGTYGTLSPPWTTSPLLEGTPRHSYNNPTPNGSLSG